MLLRLLLLLPPAPQCAGAGSKGLVGPGGLELYAGGEAKLKRGTVSDVAAGFFISGSSIADMNGVYGAAGRLRARASAAVAELRLL